MAKIRFKNNRVEDYTIVLSNRSHQHLGQLSGIKSVKSNGNMNSANEISFTVYKYKLIPEPEIPYKDIEAFRELIWKNLVDLKLVWIKELNEYYQIKVSIEDANDTIKTVTGISLGEAELSQLRLYVEINSESDIARDDYEITTFYNAENTKASLLHRCLADKAPHYTIKHVDESLHNLQRTFSVDGTSIYDFFIGKCSEQFTCLFKFDSSDRSISVYDLMTVCSDCGERGDFIDNCPKCNGINLKHYGKDTAIYVDKNNLTDAIHLETDSDSIKNCFKLEAGDDIMNAAIRSLNPNGTDYIIINRQEDLDDMPVELVQKLDEYNKFYDDITPEYQGNTEQIYDLINDILYYESSMMPTIEHAEVTAETEVQKLTKENLSPVALSTVTTSTSLATVNSALLNYAKVYIKTGYVKLEIDENKETNTFKYVGIDSNKWHYGTWTGRFKVTNYSDEDDYAYSEYLTITVTDNYQEFATQKVEKSIKTNDDDNSVFDVLAIDDLGAFESALTLYSLNRLTSFYDAIQGALDVLIQLNLASDTTSDLYKELYLPYYQKLQLCQLEIDKRQATIDDLQYNLDGLQARCEKIQKRLNFQNFLGDLYPIYCAYRREDVYSNSNYISDGLDNSQLFQRAKEFWEVAQKELKTASNGKITITTTLYNLLLIDAFKSIVEHFELGNWIRVRVDGELYRLRLIGYEINFDNLQTINVTFSTATKILNPKTEVDSILSSAHSMSTSYGAVSKQASNGQTANNSIQSAMKNGLDSGIVKIKNNNDETVVYDRHGILIREKDDITGVYSDKQCKLTHNVIAFTADNWKTAEQVVGEHNYRYYDSNINDWVNAVGYGVTTKFVGSGYITGTQIVGGEIVSDNYSVINNTGSYLNLRDGTFSFGGGKLRFEGGKIIIDSPDIPTTETITAINEEYLKATTVTASGLHINSGNIIGTIKNDININNKFIVNSNGDVTLPSTTKINWEQITDTPTILTESDVEHIVDETVDETITQTVTESITQTVDADYIKDLEIDVLDGVSIDNAENVKTNNIYFYNAVVFDSLDDHFKTGLTGSYEFGDKTVRVVNGIIVSVQ